MKNLRTIGNKVQLRGVEHIRMFKIAFENNGGFHLWKSHDDNKNAYGTWAPPRASAQDGDERKPQLRVWEFNTCYLQKYGERTFKNLVTWKTDLGKVCKKQLSKVKLL